MLHPYPNFFQRIYSLARCQASINQEKTGATQTLVSPFLAAGMPQLLILQPLLWVVPLITTSSRPRLSSAFRFNRRQGAAGAGNSPSVSEGVAEGRGSNMSVKIPFAWLAAVAQSCSLRELFLCHTEITEITENYSLRE